MLVATLACEWGASALRINAIEVSPQGGEAEAASLMPLIRFVAGASAQFLTGQTLRTRPFEGRIAFEKQSTRNDPQTGQHDKETQ
ncbi:hypothetical protein BN2475_150020 [Paraburkholderia ribeironis]|uniref:Uncharacterized protein n=2 Tax=Paraburkholderia ribeironis TaxID=1247936 RepID=A0A1N7RT55_9BURK|nr:hypothetical protein BN2475_150020 [Paraburkholderia ribeironis]